MRTYSQTFHFNLGPRRQFNDREMIAKLSAAADVDLSDHTDFFRALDALRVIQGARESLVPRIERK